MSATGGIVRVKRGIDSFLRGVFRDLGRRAGGYVAGFEAMGHDMTKVGGYIAGGCANQHS